MRLNKIFSYTFVSLIILSSITIINSDTSGGGGQDFGPLVLFPAGNGTAGNPYQIANVTDLQNMSANLSANYVLINDINASSTSGWYWNGSAYNGFNPVANDTDAGTIGFQGTKFTGSLDGKGYNITGLYINRTSGDYIGLFGNIGSGGMVTNLNLVDMEVSGGTYVGGLAGQNSGDVSFSTAEGNSTATGWHVGGLIGSNEGGTVTNCSTNVLTTGSAYYAGGLAGANRGAGMITNSTSYGATTGTDFYVGGLVADNSGTITNSKSYSTTTGTLSVGGLVAGNLGTVVDSTAFGAVTGTVYVGGLVGENTGTVTSCTGSGSATGNWSVGGLVGDNRGGVITSSLSYASATGDDSVGSLAGINNGTITTSFASGTVQCTQNNSGNLVGLNGVAGRINNTYTQGLVMGNNSVGGHTGYNLGYINNSYSRGWVIGTTEIGGFVGNNSGFVYRCFFDNITSGQVNGTGSGNISGSAGRNATAMKEQATFTGASWDFAGTWAIVETVTRPYFSFMYYTPTITTKELPPPIEDVYYFYQVQTDFSLQPPDNSLTWVFKTNASAWLNSNVLGWLWGFPGNDDIGIYYVNITITDLVGNSFNRNFTIEVVNINDPPQMMAVNLLTATEDDFYQMFYSATDDDPTNDTLTWRIETNTSSWLSINPVTGELSGTPLNDDVGQYWVKVIVEDGNGGSANTSFNLTVINTNDPPIITTTSFSLDAYEDEEYYMDFNGYDPDPTGDTITWKMVTEADWLTGFNTTSGELRGTPENDHANHSFWVNISVRDNFGEFGSINFTLFVHNTNDAPMITTINDESAMEDELYSVNYNAFDIDPTADILTWQVVTDASWLDIEFATGLLYGTPTNANLGIYSVNVSVSDGKFGHTYTAFTLTVINVNDPPEITSGDKLTATENQLYSAAYSATDIDPTDDTLTWSLSSNATWLNIDSASGVLSGTPLNDTAGTYWVNVSVNDGNGGQDSSYFVLTVGFINNNPVISTQDVTTVTAKGFYSVSYEATDDRTTVDKLVWTMNTNTNWLSFNAVTKTLSGTPQVADEGTFWVNIVVADGEGGFASRNFTITVFPIIPPNTPPELTSGKMTPAKGDTETKFTFAVHYFDEDGDAPSSIKAVIDGTPHEMALDSGDASDGRYLYEITLSTGTHSYYFTASDGKDSAVAGDNTPMTVDTSLTTPSISKADEKEEGTNWLLYLIPIIILVIVFVVFMMMRRKGEKGEPGEEEEEDELECPECGVLVGKDDTICAECGAELEEESEEPGEEDEEEEEE